MQRVPLPSSFRRLKNRSQGVYWDTYSSDVSGIGLPLVIWGSASKNSYENMGPPRVFVNPEAQNSSPPYPAVPPRCHPCPASGDFAILKRFGITRHHAFFRRQYSVHGKMMTAMTDDSYACGIQIYSQLPWELQSMVKQHLLTFFWHAMKQRGVEVLDCIPYYIVPGCYFSEYSSRCCRSRGDWKRAWDLCVDDQNGLYYKFYLLMYRTPGCFPLLGQSADFQRIS